MLKFASCFKQRYCLNLLLSTAFAARLHACRLPMHNSFCTKKGETQFLHWIFFLSLVSFTCHHYYLQLHGVQLLRNSNVENKEGMLLQRILTTVVPLYRQLIIQTIGEYTPQKLRKSHCCVPFTATFSKRRKIGSLWSERCDAADAPHGWRCLGPLPSTGAPGKSNFLEISY